MFPELGDTALERLPFEHFVGSGTPPPHCEECLEWLESGAPWKLTTTDFYEQYEFSLRHAPLPTTVRLLVCGETLSALREQLAARFCRPLSGRVDVTAHKLVSGQTIRIHNDFVGGGESHRLLLQLNRHWEPDHGGYLMLFSGPEPESLSRLLEPRNGSVQAFAISPRSHHAVSTVHAGERFTIVYSFYPAAE